MEGWFTKGQWRSIFQEVMMDGFLLERVLSHQSVGGGSQVRSQEYEKERSMGLVSEDVRSQRY